MLTFFTWFYFSSSSWAFNKISDTTLFLNLINDIDIDISLIKVKYSIFSVIL